MCLLFYLLQRVRHHVALLLHYAVLCQRVITTLIDYLHLSRRQLQKRKDTAMLKLKRRLGLAPSTQLFAALVGLQVLAYFSHISGSSRRASWCH
jgi:hypothetical protein